MITRAGSGQRVVVSVPSQGRSAERAGAGNAEQTPRNEHVVVCVVWSSPRSALHAIVTLDASSGGHRLSIERADTTGESRVLSEHPAHNSRVELVRSAAGDWLHADAPGLFAASFRREDGAWVLAYARLVAIDAAHETGLTRGAYELSTSLSTASLDD